MHIIAHANFFSILAFFKTLSLHSPVPSVTIGILNYTQKCCAAFQNHILETVIEFQEYGVVELSNKIQKHYKMNIPKNCI